MWLEIAAGAYLLGSYAYHRWIEDKPEEDKELEFRIPKTKVGTPIPLYFGRVRVHEPILAQTSPDFMIVDTAEWSMDQPGGAEFLYGIDMLFALGIGFQDGINRIHNMWAGELKMLTPTGPGLETLTGNGNYEPPAYMGFSVTDRQDRSAIDYPAGFGFVEFLNGNTAQELVDGSGINLSKTYAGDRLSTIPYAWPSPIFGEPPGTLLSLGGITPPAELPAYQGVTMAFLFNGTEIAWLFDSGITRVADTGQPIGKWSIDYTGLPIPVTGDTIPILPWIVGASPEPPQYSFEISTYPNQALYATKVGDDANPADVLWAVYRDRLGKLGLDYTRVDYETFYAAAEILALEGHGFSMFYNAHVEAEDIVMDILRQVDGMVYEDPWDGKIKLKLIRADFNATELLIISPENATLEPVTAGGRSKLTNQVSIVFENRSKDYADDSVTADNGANAVGQDGQQRPETLEMRGIKTAALAGPIASRELAARATPLKQFRAIVDRGTDTNGNSAYRVRPGDRVVVNWPKLNISGMICIVARVNKGSTTSNDVALDLIQDFHYTHRFIPSTDTGLPHYETAAA